MQFGVFQLSSTTDLARQLPIVLGITGASGAIYAARTLEWLLLDGRKVHLVVSPDGLTVIRQELSYSGGMMPEEIAGFFRAANRFLMSKPAPKIACGDVAAELNSAQDLDEKLAKAIQSDLLQVHPSDDYFAAIASGSYRTCAMVVCPCSGSTLASIAHASGRNLIHRAAEVHLKERRKLVLVTRETPLSLMQIDNMLRATQAGAVVLPAAPGWYHGVHALSDLVDFVAARILDQLDVPHERVRRWG